LVRDLLDQAQHLATRERKRPRQASLRRAVSAAYYALFHMLIRDAARFLVAGNTERRRTLRAKVERCFTHTAMGKAARIIVSGASHPWLDSITALPPALVDVAETFALLQEQRHEADYSRRSFTRSEVLAITALARKAHSDWATVRGTPAAEVFQVLLLGLQAR
jgi:uncharacterized protein (UPF0332 family)